MADYVNLIHAIALGAQTARTGRLPAGAGHHGSTGSQAAGAPGRGKGFHQQAV